MKSIKHLLILATLIIVGIIVSITSCDVIEEPYTKDGNGGQILDTNRPNILLEEFTGHKCVWCPNGSKIAKTLEKQYPGKVFIVAIHCGEMAKPESGEEYNYDFRTAEGTELDNFYKVNIDGLPRGMINRTLYNNRQTMGASNWGNAITSFWNNNKTRQVDIELSALYNANTKTITGNVKLNYLVAQSKQNRLSVWILEDNIINWQASIEAPNGIPDYQHNDVLRYSFNGTWGENVGTTTIPSDFVFEKNYSLQISDRDWNPNNLRLIAFVYDDDNGVKQVMDTKIKIKE